MSNSQCFGNIDASKKTTNQLKLQMTKILLPELRLSYFNKVGLKNTVEQIIIEKANVDYFFQNSYRGYVVVVVDV